MTNYDTLKEYEAHKEPLPSYYDWVKTKELLNYALRTMGQIAKLSTDKVDAIQCANAICLIQERLEEIK